MRYGIVRVESEGALKLAFGRGEIPVVTEQDVGENRVSFGKLRIKLKGVLSGIPSLGFDKSS